MTFTQEMTRSGRVPSSRVLVRVVRPSSPGEAASLGIPVRQPVVHLRRLRLADGEPIALESTVLIGATADAVMTADLEHGSLHETLARGRFRPAARVGHDHLGSRGNGRGGGAARRPARGAAPGRATGHRRRRRPADRGDRVRLPGRPVRARGPVRGRGPRTRAGRRVTAKPVVVEGRLVLEDRVAAGRLRIEDGLIAEVELDDGSERAAERAALHRAGLRRRPRPWRWRLRCDGRPAGARRDGAAPASAWRDLVPADRGRRRRSRSLERFADDVREWMPRRPGGRRPTARVQPRGPVPRTRSTWRP